MLCDVCGRDNPDRLLYCQDCGKRLRSAAKTSATAGGAAQSGAVQGAAAPAPSEPVATPPPAEARRSRPEAPAFTFAPAEPEVSPPPAPAPAPAAAAPTCDTCGSPNPAGYKFCAVCGAAMRAPPMAGGRPVSRTVVDPSLASPPRAVETALQPPPAAPAPPARPSQRAPAPPPRPSAPVAAAPVVTIPDAPAPRPLTVACLRCQGQNDTTARFCKYCGAPLTAGARPPAAAPAAAVPVAPAPVPVAAAAPAPVAAAPAPVPVATAHVPVPVSPAPVAAPTPAAAPAPIPTTVQTRAIQLPQAEPARLIVVVEDGSDGKAFALEGDDVGIGRLEGGIRLHDDPYVSPLHARLTRQGDRWWIEDLGSLNGVFTRVLGKRALQRGDLILLGSQVLQFQLVSEEERQLGPVSQHGTRVFGTKPVRRLARLDQRTTAGLVGDVYYLHRDETSLGREVGDIVFTSDAFLSRRHAVIRRDPASDRFDVEDLDSSNGTFLAIREKTALAGGDRLRIGQHLFRFEAPGGRPVGS